MSAPVFGGVEAGGAKFVCGAGSGPADLVRAAIPTTTPVEPLDRVIQFFREQNGRRPLQAIVSPRSARSISIRPRPRTTPKPGWSNFDICGALREALGLPVAFDTDVNAAGLAESKWGAGQEMDNILYLTVGSGIGGGAIIRGLPLRGLSHPQMGHLRIPHDRAADLFPGVCPYHGDCLEGLASGPSIERRWNMPTENLPPAIPRGRWRRVISRSGSQAWCARSRPAA